MSQPAIMSKKVGEVREEICDKIRKKSGKTEHNLAQILEQTTSDKLADEAFIEGQKMAFPEFKDEIIYLHENVKKLQKTGEEAYNFLDYFEESGQSRKFQPRWLAKDIMKDYNFIWVRELEKLYVYKNGYWKPQGERIIEEECNKRLGEEHRENRTREVKGIIEKEKSISKHDFRPPENKINFKNCVYDLENDEKLDHSPEYYFTQKVPFEYDKNAQCPLIHDFLDEVTDNQEDKETLLEAAGYTLLASMPISQAFILVGKGSNGKTIYLEMLKEMLGRENYKEEELQQLENTRFATQSLYQKLALFCDDLPSQELKTGTTFKALTGGGDVRAEDKGGAHYEFKNYATPIFACNDIPKTKDESDGFFRRWKIINFPYKFTKNPEKDMEKQARPKQEILKELLDEEEIKGLINEAVTHLQLVLEQGFFTYDYEPEITRKIWRSYSDPIDEFLEKYVEQGITKNEAERKSVEGDLTSFEFDYIIKDDLLELVSKYCEARSTRPPTKSELTKHLNKRDLYFTTTRSKIPGENDSRTQIYRGLRFTNEFFGELKSYQGFRGYRNILRVRVKEDKITQRFFSEYGNPGRIEDSEEKAESGTLKDEIYDFIDSNSSKTGVHRDDVYKQFESKDEMNIQEALDNLTRDGEIFEPKPGKLKTV